MLTVFWREIYWGTYLWSTN